jgi:hypothetical protein
MGGGASGGGIILGLHGGTYTNNGTIQANGGLSGDISGGSNGDGGAGGNGSVLIEQIDGGNSCPLDSSSVFSSGVSVDNSATIEMLKREDASFSLLTDFVKFTTEATATTITNAAANFYQSYTDYTSPNSSSAITLNPSALIKRVTNPPTDFSSGVPNSGVTVAYDTHPATASVFHGIFEINLALDMASFDGTVTVDIYIQKPGESFKKIGQITTQKPTSGAWNVKYYWNSRAAAYDWTSPTDTQAYRTDGLIRFKFQVR